MVGCHFKLSNVGVIYYMQYITGAPAFEALLDYLLTSYLIFTTSASFYPLLQMDMVVPIWQNLSED